MRAERIESTQMAEKLREYTVELTGVLMLPTGVVVKVSGTVSEEYIKKFCGICDHLNGCEYKETGKVSCDDPRVGSDKQAWYAHEGLCGFAVVEKHRPPEIIFGVGCSGLRPPSTESEAQPQKAPDIKH